MDCAVQVLYTLTDFLPASSISYRERDMKSDYNHGFVYSFSSVSFSLMYFDSLWLGAYTFRIFMCFWRIDLFPLCNGTLYP